MGGNGSIKAVIFDLGNVLVDFNHRVAAEKLAGLTGKTAGEIYDLFFDSGLTGLFEEGKISPGDFFLSVKEILGLKIGYHEFVPIWNEIFFLSEKNHAVYRLAVALSKRYKTALLSNINILHFEYIKKTFPVFSAFKNIFTSFEMGSRKPQSKIYYKALEAIGVPAQEAFYTDDREELVESAKILGIKSFVFSGVEKLKDDLLGAGIEIS